jgi:hypothetical protein
MRQSTEYPTSVTRHRFDPPTPHMPLARFRPYPLDLRTTQAGREHPARSSDVPAIRYQIQIQRSRREAETIATILRRHGGVCVDFGATRIYELPSEAAYDAALSAVRSVHGWTSVEPRY